MTATSDNLFAAAFEGTTPVSFVESDRFCGRCGYNLRHQPVRVEPQTRLPLLRCPECGRFEHASDAITTRERWLHRLGGPALILWVVFILGLFVGLGSMVLVMQVAYFEGRISHSYESGPGGTHQVIATLQSFDRADEVLALSMITGISLGCGFAGALILTVCMPHWRRVWYSVAAIAWPVAAWLFFFTVVRFDVARDGDAASIYTQVGLEAGSQVVATMATGLLGVWFGRPIVRGLVRVVVPPRLRTPLAYLWLVDDKTFPGRRATTSN